MPGPHQHHHRHEQKWRVLALLRLVAACSLLTSCATAVDAVAHAAVARRTLRQDAASERHGGAQTQRARQQSSIRLAWDGDVYLVKPKFNATVVSGLYDIGRGSQGDGRQIDHYLEWFKKTLAGYNGPMVVFVATAEHAEFVVKARQGQYTHVIVRPLERLKYIPLRHVANANLKSEKFRRCREPPSRMEYVNDAYCMLVFMKLPLLEEVAAINPYHTKYFLWIDAGISRFWNEDIAQQGNWPSMQRMLELDPAGDKIFIKRGGVDDTGGQRVDDAFEFMCGNGNGFWAPVIGGTAAAIANAAKDQEDFLYREMLAAGSVGNEQMFFAVWASRNSSRVVHWPWGGGNGYSGEANETEFMYWLSDRALGRTQDRAA